MQLTFQGWRVYQIAWSQCEDDGSVLEVRDRGRAAAGAIICVLYILGNNEASNQERQSIKQRQDDEEPGVAEMRDDVVAHLVARQTRPSPSRKRKSVNDRHILHAKFIAEQRRQSGESAAVTRVANHQHQNNASCVNAQRTA